MNNIILIGMPGVGKSTLGVILAKIIGCEFIDTDLVIQKKCGTLLKDIISEKGVDGFIDTENRICAKIEASNSVIATGGSVIYGKDAMEHLRTIGTVVYLRQSFDTINKRLSDIKGRGVVLKEGQTLHDIFLERSPLYEKYAHIICDMTEDGIEENLNIVLKSIKSSELH